jgi:hypothetical protein
MTQTKVILYISKNSIKTRHKHHILIIIYKIKLLIFKYN